MESRGSDKTIEGYVDRFYLRYNEALKYVEQMRNNDYCFHPHIEGVEVVE